MEFPLCSIHTPLTTYWYVRSNSLPAKNTAATITARHRNLRTLLLRISSYQTKITPRISSVIIICFLRLTNRKENTSAQPKYRFFSVLIKRNRKAEKNTNKERPSPSVRMLSEYADPRLAANRFKSVTAN